MTHQAIQRKEFLPISKEINMRNMIILPTYNERENIALIISNIVKTIPNIRIMVVDDNSPDGTAQIVRELQNQFPDLLLYERKIKEGLGNAYKDSFEKILKELDVENIITMDSDFSHAPEDLLPMLKFIQTCDVVIGSRYIPGGKICGWKLRRRVLSRLGNLYCKIMIGVPINDLTGGFNVISVKALQKIPFRDILSSGFAFFIELKTMLWKSGAKILESPITFQDRVAGSSKISKSIITEGLKAPWKIILKNSPQ